MVLPSGACDSHIHVIGPFSRYPLQVARTPLPPEAAWDRYQREACAAGLERAVIVQPSFFGTDNRCTLDAVARAPGAARAVVVVDPGISRQALEALHAQGARGVRFNIFSGGLGFAELAPVADRIRDLGWHIQIFTDSELLPDLADRLLSLDIDIVFDHMAHTRRMDGVDGKGFRLLLELVQTERFWVKLSNALFPASSERARLLIGDKARHVLWGSDWPHVIYEDEAKGLKALLTDLAGWADDLVKLKTILVDNPDQLYFRD